MIVPPKGQRASTPTGRDKSTLRDSYEPSLSEVIGAYQSETYAGVGSMAYTVRAALPEFGEDIPEESWKSHPYYRENLPWHKGLKTGTAKVNAENFDRKEYNNFILSKATTAQSAVGLASAFVTGIAEPKNVGEGILVSKGVGLIGGAVLASSMVNAKRLVQIARDAKTYKALAAKGAGEGVLSAAVADPTNTMSAKAMGDEYTIVDRIFNYATSVGFGVSMHVGGKYFKDRKAAAIEKSDLALKAVIEDAPIKETDAEALVANNAKAKAQEEAAYFEKAKEDVKQSLTPEDQAKFAMHDEIMDIENNKTVYAYGIDDPQIINALETIRTQQKSAPDKSLFKFLKSKGGVRSEGGEFKAMGISGRTMPGLVNNKTGMTLDDAAIAAHEAGLISEPDSRELLNLMDEVNRGLHNTIGNDANVNAAEQFLTDEGISATEYIAKYNKAAPELDARVAALRQQAGPDPYAMQRQNVAEANAEVAAFPPDSEILPKAKSAMQALYGQNEQPPVEVMPKEEVVLYSEHDKALQKAVDDFVEEGHMSEEEVLQMEADIEDKSNGIKTAVNCLLGLVNE